jgi:hypothetical protein
MKRLIFATALFIGATAGAHASPLVCSAKLLHLEETAWTLNDYPIARITMRVTAPRTRPFETTVEMPVSLLNPPRPGLVLRVSCDPANPTDVHLLN